MLQNKYYQHVVVIQLDFFAILLANLISDTNCVKKENDPLGSSISSEHSEIKLISVIIYHFLFSTSLERLFSF